MQVEAPTGETGEPANPHAESLGYICRVAVQAMREGGTAKIPLDDMRHLGLAGVHLDNILGVPGVVVTDPGAYTAGLQGLQRPENTDEQHAQASLLTHANAEAVASLAHAYIRQNAGVIQDIYDGHMPIGSYVTVALRMPDENYTVAQQAVINTLAGHAAALATESERLGTHQATVDALNMLAAAHEEGLVSEFAAAYDLGVVATVDTDAIGVDRLSMPRDWDPTYKFLQHLRDNAPNSRFTRQVRDTLIRDIDRQLAGGDTTQIAPLPENSVFMHPGDEAEAQAWREETARGAVGMLRQARQWINHLLPIEE